MYVLNFDELQVRTSDFEYGEQTQYLNTFSFVVTFVIKIILQWHFSSLSQNNRAVCCTEF